MTFATNDRPLVHMKWICVFGFIVQFGYVQFGYCQNPQAKSLKASSCYIRTYEEASIPALEQGIITNAGGKEGDLVESGQILAVLDDDEAKLQYQMAKVQLEIEERKFADSFAMKIADAKVNETQQSINKSSIQKKIAATAAESTTAIEQAKKALATSQADLDRALAARREFEGAVSEAELNRLTFMRDSSILDIQSAQEKRALAALEIDVASSSVATAQAILERLQHERSQANTDREVAKIELRRLQLQLELADAKLQRRKLKAPFPGMLVEQLHHRGEWIEPGEPVFRIVRLDRLVVEGYADAEKVHHSMRGAKVIVRSIDDPSAAVVEGNLSFVSPIIDPVNQQVQVRAVVDNKAGKLRAGQAVEMTIELP